MLPELLAVGAVGSLFSAISSVGQLVLYSRKRKSPKSQRLNMNLHKVGKFWSEVNSRVETGGIEIENQHNEQYKKTIIVIGALFFFLSWLGFIFQLIIFLSVSVFPIFRNEKEIFDSELCRKDLSTEEVLQILDGQLS